MIRHFKIRMYPPLNYVFCVFVKLVTFDLLTLPTPRYYVVSDSILHCPLLLFLFYYCEL